MIVRVLEAKSVSSEPLCAPKSAKIRWECDREQLGQLLQLLELRKEQLFELIRQKMDLEERQSIKLTIFCRKDIVEEINRHWDRLVLVHMRKMLEFDSLLWNLSTFGGAFSSMGDYDPKWAAKAGLVSKHQVKLAREMGNETLEARCYLYMALSDAQLGKIDEAKRTTRLIYAYAESTQNEFLANCARGVFFKIKDIVQYLKRRSA